MQYMILIQCGLCGTDRIYCSFPCCWEQWTWVICLIVVMYYCMTLQLQIPIPTQHIAQIANTETIKLALPPGAVAVLSFAHSGRHTLINFSYHPTQLLLQILLYLSYQNGIFLRTIHYQEMYCLYSLDRVTWFESL